MRRAANARQKDAHDRDLILAWQIEKISIMAVQRDGGRKTPDLNRLLSEGTRRHAQTHEERAAVMHAMSATYGVPLQRMVKGPDGQYHDVN